MDKNILKQDLTKCVAKITFNKADGTLREMVCTLMEDYLPTPQPLDETPKLPRRESDNVLAVWDIDNKGWRSFRVDSIKEFEIIGVNYNAAST
jgi:WYL_2, Sm-like SH3 beta-barrel fold